MNISVRNSNVRNNYYQEGELGGLKLTQFPNQSSWVAEYHLKYDSVFLGCGSAVCLRSGRKVVNAGLVISLTASYWMRSIILNSIWRKFDRKLLELIDNRELNDGVVNHNRRLGHHLKAIACMKAL